VSNRGAHRAGGNLAFQSPWFLRPASHIRWL